MPEAESEDEFVRFYLAQIKTGDRENAFHCLLEAGPSLIPKLIDAFRRERDASVRAELLDVIWNHRIPETVQFLGEALADQNPVVWKSALNGLVTLGTPAAVDQLNAALSAHHKNARNLIFPKWVSEAISQITTDSV